MTLEHLAAALDGISEYAELRGQTNTSASVSMVNGNLVGNAVTEVGGVSARVCAGRKTREMWGFSSAPEQTAESAKAVLETARDNALFLSGRCGRDMGLYSEDEAAILSRPRLDRSRAGARERLETVRSADDYIARKYPSLISRRVSLNGFSMEKTLAASGGTRSHTFLSRIHLSVMLSAENPGGEPVNLMMKQYGGLGEFEDYFPCEEKLYRRIDETYEDLMKKREGVRPESGVKTCVLAPDLAGILAHEAVGHTVECDLVRGGSVAGRLLGQTVASEKISIFDFAHTAFGQTCPVPVYVDDEGVLARDAVLIDKGVLKGFMHNRQTAREYGSVPAGNARAFTFSDEPLIRMRNTCILPGPDKLSDMIASVEDGYYLSRPTNGQADLTGEFMFGLGLGFEIKNGKLGRAITDTTVSGVAFDMLKTVTMVSDDLVWESAGYCGKKQPMIVSMGGPAIVCSIMVGGS